MDLGYTAVETIQTLIQRRKGLLCGPFLFSYLMAQAPPQPVPNAEMNTTHITPTDPRILVMGRTDARNGELRMGFPGVTLRFAYRGPAPTLLLGTGSPNCSFNLRVNGWDPVIVRPKEGQSALPLPSGPAPTSGWVVELTRRNENWQGIASFRGLELPKGCELIAPPPFPQRKLMFIGDSITCGEKIDLLPPEDNSSPRMSNAPRAFGMLLGRTFGAQVHLVSCGGRGLTRNWQGVPDVTAPQFFQRAMPDEADAAWNHAAYVPDGVVIGLGTNDFNTGLPDEQAFTDAYEAFLQDIRKVYPQTALVLMESPIFGEVPGTHDREKRDLLRRVLDTLVTRHQAAGDRKIALASSRHYPGTAIDAHPVAFQHEQIAEELAPVIERLTGWKRP